MCRSSINLVCAFTSDTLHILFGQYIDVIFVILPTMALYSNVSVILITQVYLIFLHLVMNIVRIVRDYIFPS